MKKFNKYISTMYRPSYIMLRAGLCLFSVGLILLSLDLRDAVALQKADIVGTYGAMLEELIFPMYILLPVTAAVDLNERKKKK